MSVPQRTTARKRPLVDACIPGAVYGRLTIIELAPAGPKRQTRWRCHCQCGRETVAGASGIRKGTTTSCGCYKRERIVATSTKHGRSFTPIHRTWSSMLTRCYNTRSSHYPRYGGIGVTVCDRWRTSFSNFLADVGEKPSPQHSLDRFPDPFGNYEPGNVRWATLVEQRRNWRHKKLITWKGRAQLLTDWARELNMSFVALHRRKRMGWTTEEMFTTPVQPRTRRPHV